MNNEFLNDVENIIEHKAHRYGEPTMFFKKLSRLWSLMLDIEINEHDVVNMFIQMKLLRLQNNPNHLDTQKDIVGYTTIQNMLTNDKIE